MFEFQIYTDSFFFFFLGSYFYNFGHQLPVLTSDSNSPVNGNEHPTTPHAFHKRKAITKVVRLLIFISGVMWGVLLFLLPLFWLILVGLRNKVARNEVCLLHPLSGCYSSFFNSHPAERDRDRDSIPVALCNVLHIPCPYQNNFHFG